MVRSEYNPADVFSKNKRNMVLIKAVVQRRLDHPVLQWVIKAGGKAAGTST